MVSCSVKDAIFIFCVWFLKFVEMSFRPRESFSRDRTRSDLMDPTILAVPNNAKLATLAKTNGRSACEEPRCGVERKAIPATDFVILSNSQWSIIAVTSA